jgi:hypothetical protein
VQHMRSSERDRIAGRSALATYLTVHGVGLRKTQIVWFGLRLRGALRLGRIAHYILPCLQ